MLAQVFSDYSRALMMNMLERLKNPIHQILAKKIFSQKKGNFSLCNPLEERIPQRGEILKQNLILCSIIKYSLVSRITQRNEFPSFLIFHHFYYALECWLFIFRQNFPRRNSTLFYSRHISPVAETTRAQILLLPRVTK